MFRIYSTLIEMLAASVFILPVFAIYNKFFFHSGKRTALYIVFGFYIAAILGLIGFPGITSLTVEFSVNLIPFIGMASDFVNACLNILLFVPFGLFLPILWSKFRSIKGTALMGLITSCVVEVSQIFTFRTTDINDLITNTVGTIIGYYTAQFLTGKFTKHIVLNSQDRDFYIICGSIGFIMFLLQPFIASLLWEMVL